VRFCPCPREACALVSGQDRSGILQIPSMYTVDGFVTEMCVFLCSCRLHLCVSRRLAVAADVVGVVRRGQGRSTLTRASKWSWAPPWPTHVHTSVWCGGLRRKGCSGVWYLARRPHGTTVDEIAVSFIVVDPLGAPAALIPPIPPVRFLVCQEPMVELQQFVRLSGLTNPCLLTRCFCRFTGTGDVHALAAALTVRSCWQSNFLLLSVECASIVQVD
jgi:hypothetical protein